MYLTRGPANDATLPISLLGTPLSPEEPLFTKTMDESLNINMYNNVYVVKYTRVQTYFTTINNISEQSIIDYINK